VIDGAYLLIGVSGPAPCRRMRSPDELRAMFLRDGEPVPEVTPETPPHPAHHGHRALDYSHPSTTCSASRAYFGIARTCERHGSTEKMKMAAAGDRSENRR